MRSVSKEKKGVWSFISVGKQESPQQDLVGVVKKQGEGYARTGWAFVAGCFSQYRKICQHICFL